MDMQNFLEHYLPRTSKLDISKYQRYLYLKTRLERQIDIKSSEEGGSLFNEFVALKDMLFNEAMENFIKRRENGDI